MCLPDRDIHSGRRSASEDGNVRLAGAVLAAAGGVPAAAGEISSLDDSMSGEESSCDETAGSASRYAGFRRST